MEGITVKRSRRIQCPLRIRNIYLLHNFLHITLLYNQDRLKGENAFVNAQELFQILNYYLIHTRYENLSIGIAFTFFTRQKKSILVVPQTLNFFFTSKMVLVNKIVVLKRVNLCWLKIVLMTRKFVFCDYFQNTFFSRKTV